MHNTMSSFASLKGSFSLHYSVIKPHWPSAQRSRGLLFNLPLTPPTPLNNGPTIGAKWPARLHPQQQTTSIQWPSHQPRHCGCPGWFRWHRSLFSAPRFHTVHFVATHATYSAAWHCCFARLLCASLLFQERRSISVRHFFSSMCLLLCVPFFKKDPL